MRRNSVSGTHGSLRVNDSNFLFSAWVGPLLFMLEFKNC